MISLFPIEGEIFPTQGEIFALENFSQRHPGPKCESEPSGKGWGGVGRNSAEALAEPHYHTAGDSLCMSLAELCL